MRRTLLLIPALMAVLAGTFLVSFTFSKHNVRGQPYLTSLSDFLFMIDSYRRLAVGAAVPPLDDAAYESVMGRFGEETHWEVERRARWHLRQWGGAVVPRLLEELDPGVAAPRLEAAVETLGEIGDPRSAGPLGRLLDHNLALPEPAPRLSRVLVDALGETRDPSAAAPLMRYLEWVEDVPGPSRGEVLEALGQTGGANDFLLAEFASNDDPDHVHARLWPLAHSRDPRAASLLADLLRHPLYDIRQRSRDAMDQAMGPVAIDPVLDILEAERDDFVRYAIVHDILDDRDARSNPRVVPAVARLLDHPPLAWAAVYSLARLGGPRAAAALERHAEKDPAAVLEHMEYLGATARKIVTQQLTSPDPRIRHQALGKAVEIHDPAMLDAVEPLLDDRVGWVARAARRTLLSLDKVALHASFSRSLPEPFGRSVWLGFRPDRFGYGHGVEDVWPVLTTVHVVGTVLSALLGLLLVFGALRVLEPFPLQVAIIFLLAEGVVGDFFFMDQGAKDPWLLYRVATASHLLLLIGFVFLERGHAPGELRSRFARFGGASLWLVAPPLLIFGTGPLAEALRLELQVFGRLLGWIVILTIAAALVFERWLVPWHTLPRRARGERVVVAVLASAALGLFAAALARLGDKRSAAGDGDGALLCVLLTLPLAWLLLVHLHSMGLLRRGAAKRELAPPAGRLRVIQDGDSIRVRIDNPARRPGLRRLLSTAFVISSGAVAGVVAGRGGGGPGLVLALFASALGSALAALVIQASSLPVILQIRKGYVRGGATLLGATLVGGAWGRRPVFSKLVAGRLSRGRRGGGSSPLAREERAWLRGVIEGGDGGEPTRGADEKPRLGLQIESLEPKERSPSTLGVSLLVRNEGEREVCPADVDAAHGRLAWGAQVDGRAAELCFSRGDRERRIPPGATVRLHPRLHLGAVLAVSTPPEVEVRAGDVQSKRVTPGNEPR